MLRAARRRPREVEPGVVGTVRVLRRGAVPGRRLRAGEVAVVDLLDLDGPTAEALAARRPAVVLNASPSTSGRYPNLGPGVLVDAGVPLVDDLGPDLLLALQDGDRVRVHEGRVEVADGRHGWQDAEPPLQGTEQDEESVAEQAEAARAGMAAQLDAFAASTAVVLDSQRDLLLEGVGIPRVPVDMAGRPVLVVTRGYGWADDLRALRRFVAERRPVLVAVEDGADALLARGLRPHVVVTDGSGASDEALTCGAHVVAHVSGALPPTGVRVPAARSAGPEEQGEEDPRHRLERLGLRPAAFESGLTSEDTAVLLAHAGGARTIVTVGSHATLEEFLDRGRAGMASSFLARLRAGATVVDASTAAVLHQPRMSWGMVVLLLVAGVVAVGASLAATPWGQEQLDALASLDAVQGLGWWGGP